MKEVLLPALGSSIAGGPEALGVHDFTTEQERDFLGKMAGEYGVPQQWTSYMYTFIKQGGRTLVLLGHPPKELIQSTLAVSDRPPRLLINQDEMHEKPQSYDLWAYSGNPMRFPISVPVAQALKRLK